MNLSHQGQQQEHESTPGDIALVVPLDTLDRTSLPAVGGKAANLGELIRAGFAVPSGFCITTVAYARVYAHAGLDAALTDLAATDRLDRVRQADLAAQVRTALLASSLPSEIAEHIAAA